MLASWPSMSTCSLMAAPQRCLQLVMWRPLHSTRAPSQGSLLSDRWAKLMCGARQASTARNMQWPTCARTCGHSLCFLYECMCCIALSAAPALVGCITLMVYTHYHGCIVIPQGAPLADNLRRYLTGQQLRSFVPQSTSLALISAGRPYAVGTKGWLAFEGAWAWTLKVSGRQPC